MVGMKKTGGDSLEDKGNEVKSKAKGDEDSEEKWKSDQNNIFKNHITSEAILICLQDADLGTSVSDFFILLIFFTNFN
jgi:hypothetical protein